MDHETYDASMSVSCDFDIQLCPNPVAYQPLSFPESGGAEAVFLGRTRAEMHSEHGPLTGLDYEAHEKLALSTMQQLALETAERFGCLCIRLHHAVGPVPIGEASVLIQVACAHRDASFLAGRYLIDELKTRVPIWKREMWQSGHSWSAGQPVSTSQGSDPS